jgi:AcrR family transcriptional regulator
MLAGNVVTGPKRGRIVSIAESGRTRPREASHGRQRIDRSESSVVAIADMTSRQLVRRAKIIEAVIDLIGEVGAEAVQMRDVAQRSGVALATVYRYFSSKDHLLAAALEDWQKRLVSVLDYLRRALRAFHHNPEMTALMLQTLTSADPEARAAIDQMNRTNAEMFDELLEGAAPEDIPNISFGISATLSNALTALLTRTLTFDETLSRVEWVARTLLGSAPSPK